MTEELTAGPVVPADGAGPDPAPADGGAARTEDAAWAVLLTALAGRIADARLARAWPDRDGRLDEVAAGLDEAGAPLGADGVRSLLAVAVPGDPAALAGLLARLGLPAGEFAFEPWPDGGAAAPVDVPLSDARVLADPVAAAAARAAAGPGARGLWAALRSEDDDDPGVPVFLLEVAPGESTVDHAVRLRAALVAAGEATPRVEVFRTGDRLPDYQRAARGGGTLLWAAPAPAPELVPVFDAGGDGGPRFAADRPVLSTVERAGVVDYLRAAAPVLLTTAVLADVVEPDRGEVVPLTFRTDGRYVWPEAVAYYAAEYGLAPHPPLLDAIRAAGYRPPAADGVALFRARAAVLTPAG
jgi:hypothetical protein